MVTHCVGVLLCYEGSFKKGPDATYYSLMSSVTVLSPNYLLSTLEYCLRGVPVTQTNETLEKVVTAGTISFTGVS